jgi:PAS domain S-box-containing protein
VSGSNKRSLHFFRRFFSNSILQNLNKSRFKYLDEGDLKLNQLDFKELFERSLNAVACGKIILDEHNVPVDYVFIDVNDAFEKHTGIPRNKALGRSVKELIPGIEKSEFDWIGEHARIAFGGKEKRFEQFENHLNRWYSVYIYSPRKGYFINVFSDITERKSLEQKLIELLKFNELILSSIPSILMEVNFQKKYVWANKDGLNFFGEDCIGKEAKDYFIENDTVYDLVEPLFNGTADILHVENWQKRKDGQKRLLAWKCVSLKNKKGEIIGALSSAQDVTEQRLVETALKDAEQKYEIVANNTYDWEFWINVNREFIYSSPSCLRITGYSASEFYKDKEILNRIIHPADKERYDAHVSDYSSYTKDARELDFRILTKDGRVVWISHVCQKIKDSNGKELGVRGSNRDITERKNIELNLSKSRNYLNNILNSVGAPLFVKDANHQFIMVNDAFCKWIGYSKEYLVGKIDSELFPAEQIKVFWKNDDLVIQTGDSALEEERVTDANGVEHIILSKKSLYITDKGFKELVCIITDITKRNETEIELKKRNEELERFNQFSIERELKMIALKKEINELYKKLGESKRYELA